MPIYNDPEKYLKYIEPIEIGAIIPSELPYGVKFDITSIMIQLLNVKDVFIGFLSNEANMYIMNFMGIYTS